MPTKKRPLSAVEETQTQWWIVQFNPERSCSTIIAKATCDLLLEGWGRLRCVSGEPLITVNGYELNTHDDWVDFDSPSFASWTTVSLSQGSILEVSAPSRLCFRIHSKEDADAQPTLLPPSWKSTVDAMRRDWTRFGERQKAESQTNSAFHSSCMGDDDSMGASTDNCFKVMITGSKGVGKSTFLRYCVNRLLSDSGVSQVAILDLDLGQPELSPPGLLTLSLQSQPLLKLPYSHFLSTDLPEYVNACFFGSITSQADPELYLDCVRTLVDSYVNKVGAGIPLLINLDGWVNGLGREILQTMIHEVIVPTHVVQLATKGSSLDLDSSRTTLHACLPFDSEESARSNPAVRPVALRELRFLAYFVHDRSVWEQSGIVREKPGENHVFVDPSCILAEYLAAASPYVVPWDDVECTFASVEQQTDLGGSRGMNDNERPAFLNGAIVGLLHHSGPSRSQCCGLGIVRAIDTTKRLLYVLTPVRQELVEQVDVLCRAGPTLPLPLAAVFRGQKAESLPYMCFNAGKVPALGADPMRSRKTIGRRYLNNQG